MLELADAGLALTGQLAGRATGDPGKQAAQQQADRDTDKRKDEGRPGDHKAEWPEVDFNQAAIVHSEDHQYHGEGESDQ